MRYIDEMINRYGEELAMELIEELWDWRDIEGYEGLYKVSECGDVMSLQGGRKTILSPNMTRRGYLQVGLCKNGTRKQHRIHRLVATAFCEGAGEFEEVNHIDEDKTNNHYENLEWCNRQYNVNYGAGIDKRSKKMMGNKNATKKVRCVELDMTFDSTTEASEYLNCSRCNISSCLSGRIERCANYHWEYVE